MITIPGFLSEKILSRERVTAQFVTEIRLHLFALALFIIGLEGYLLKKGGIHGSERSAFVLTAFCFFALYSLLEYLFRLFTGKRASAVLSLLPAGIVFLFLRDSAVRNGLATTVVAAAAIVAAAVRAACSFMPYRDSVLQYGVFVLDAVAIYFRFGRLLLDGSFPTDRILFIVLTILTLSSLQKIVCERNRDAFPFHYFILIGVIMLSAPMGKDPIDWTPVVKTGQRVAESALGIVDRASYYLSSLFQSGDYTTGYSSLLVDGRRVNQTDKTQLNLKIYETPYHVFRDAKTDKNMVVKKTVYLTGGRAADRAQLIRFLKFMRDHGVSHEYAALFSEVAKMDVEYAYLDTFDEIAPVNSIVLQSEKGKIVEGTGIRRHRKGYRIEAEYLDIDYGSPYLIDLLRQTGDLSPFSYDDACQCMTELFGVSFEKIMTREEYEEAYKEAIDAAYYMTASDEDDRGGSVKEKNENPLREYLATDGADTRMKELARDITKNAENCYDACRLIEQYLRQYTYDTDTVGGYDPKSNMSTSEGMADIAQRFLFETQKGYCVQYTSAMVILLRLSGIPARAQTGFRYVFPLEAESVYPVSSNCAHVWPEAFIDGFGWVPFEPTAGFRPQADYTWRRKAKSAPESTGDYD
ncbi:MAG: transglutaminase domain-containing protein, partial [Lachnospiraceae bacterium]|nr:transglutaminase domain-containing protein [Lachnospiraceae bacterium]